MNRLKEVRERQNLSQFELAKKSDVRQSDISCLENEKIYPYSGWRKRLATALEVDEDYLFPELEEQEGEVG